MQLKSQAHTFHSTKVLINNPACRFKENMSSTSHIFVRPTYADYSIRNRIQNGENILVGSYHPGTGRIFCPRRDRQSVKDRGFYVLSELLLEAHNLELKQDKTCL